MGFKSIYGICNTYFLFHSSFGSVLVWYSRLNSFVLLSQDAKDITPKVRAPQGATNGNYSVADIQ